MLSKITNWFFKEKFLFLLATLFLYAMAAPFFEGFMDTGLFMNIMFMVVLLSAAYTVNNQKKNMLTVIAITICCVTFFCLRFFVENEGMLIAEIVFKVLFNASMLLIVLRFIFKSHFVSGDTISAALIGYLLLALLWTNLYFLLELIYPNSFTVSHEIILSDPAAFRYFSFVTITTLGYGDIAPISSQARNMAVIEAFIGQFYLAVIIARLVGIHAAQRSK